MSKIICAFIFTLSLFINTSEAVFVPDSFADLVEKLMPSVVNISTTQKVVSNRGGFFRLMEDITKNEEIGEFLERFGVVPPDNIYEDGAYYKRPVSLGSGFIVDKEGYIATNHHVIADADEIIVHLSNHKEYTAKVVGLDVNTDLALLKIDANIDLPFVKFGDSEKARIGDWVIAIGNQLGLDGTVTAGIISAKYRDINASAIVDNFIQTDAAINAGSSGGPMFNTKGEVIGVNTSIISPSRGNVGIGFATPSSIVKIVLEQLKNNGKVTRSYLGITTQQIDEEIAESLGIDADKGTLIKEVTSNSPAAKAGLKAGDIIVSFDAKEITSRNKLPRIVAETPLKKQVEIVYLRKNDKRTTQVILAELIDKDAVNEEVLESATNAKSQSKDFYGLVVSEVNDDLREKYDLDKEVSGCIIVRIASKGLWIHRGIQKGDVIVAANQEYINSPEELDKIIKKSLKRKRKSVLLLINQDNKLTFLTMPIVGK